MAKAFVDLRSCHNHRRIHQYDFGVYSGQEGKGLSTEGYFFLISAREFLMSASQLRMHSPISTDIIPSLPLFLSCSMQTSACVRKPHASSVKGIRFNKRRTVVAQAPDQFGVTRHSRNKSQRPDHFSARPGQQFRLASLCRELAIAMVVLDQLASFRAKFTC